MTPSPDRRQFLHAAALIGGAAPLLGRLRPVSAAEAQLDPKLVHLDPEIEPLVRLIEETPRGSLLEEVAARVRKGLSYRELLAALLLAGVRNIQPRPSVGFKFHAVLVVNSAHLASLASPDEHRWLPIFWALDNFKSAQATNIKEGGWRMAPVNESNVPPPRKAAEAFRKAMDNWDVPAADAAAAGLARGVGAHEVFELFARYGLRDFRDIGHKAIFVANAWRTLHCIGWQHAEPVLRSLAYALLRHEGENPATRDYPADRPGRQNRERAAKIRPDWLGGTTRPSTTTRLLNELHAGSVDDVCDQVVKLLNAGNSPQSLWDALLVGAGELLMRQPGIVGLHTVTTTNAMRYAFEASGDDETRRMLLLQNAAFLPLFREAMKGRGAIGNGRLDRLEPLPTEKSGAEAVTEIFGDISRDRTTAARKALAYLKEPGGAKELADTARLMVFLKGNDSHDYKFGSAVLEDYAHVSPAWRDRYLAAGMFHFRGSAGPNTPLVGRIGEALKG